MSKKVPDGAPPCQAMRPDPCAAALYCRREVPVRSAALVLPVLVRVLSSASVPTDQAAELLPQPPAYALERGLGGPLASRYAAAVAAIRAGNPHLALPSLREARALAYRDYIAGKTPRRPAYRHFARLLYAEELQLDLVDIERQLHQQRDPLPSEDKMRLLHERALLLHNQFLLVRTFTGQSDARLLGQALDTYEALLGKPSQLRTTVQIGYAALLGERGDLHGAQAAFARVNLEDQQAERYDLPVAYYYLAIGNRPRAMARLAAAAHRDTWDHAGAGQDGRTVRSLVYRMNDFDLLRDHPLFIELVTDPEESAL